MMMLSSRILDLVKEDVWQKLLPWPASQVRDEWWLSSRAEKMFGQYHMSLNKVEMRRLVEQMIGSGMFGLEYAKDVRKHFYRRYRLGIGWQYLEKAWRYGPAVAVGLAAAVIMVIAKKLKEDIEEVAKEA